MTTPAPTNEKQLAPYDSLVKLVRSDDVRARFEDVLGANARAFLASLLTLASSDNLRDCEPRSILVAAMKAATLGLPVDPAIGQAWIVPYRNKHKNGRKEAQFQLGYKGFGQLALRTHEYRRINVGEVHEGQQIVQDQLTGEVTITGAKDPTKPVIGFFAYYILNDGFEDFRYMTVEEIIDHAKHYSKSWGQPGNAWQDEREFPKMAKKTILKRLLNSGVAPLSVDLKQMLKEDEAEEEEQEEGVPLGEAGEVINGELKDVTKQPEQPTPPEPETSTMTNNATNTEILVQTNAEKVQEQLRLIKWLLDEGLAVDEKEAIFLVGNWNADIRDEKSCTDWAKGYRGWIDMGDKPANAAKAVNEGKMPK